MKNKILFLALFPVLVFVLSNSIHDAAATSYVIGGSDGGDCTSLGGTWQNNECSIDSLTISSGNSLTIDSGTGIGLVTTIQNSGIFTNNGVIIGYSITNDGTFTNNGNVGLQFGITNNGGTINNSGQIQNGGTFSNNGGTINNSGTLLPGGTSPLNNDGIITNNLGGSIAINYGLINSGNITNSGSIFNYDTSTIKNNVGGNIINNAEGSISAFSPGSLNNAGAIFNSGSIYFSSVLNSGIIQGSGQFKSSLGSVINTGSITSTVTDSGVPDLTNSTLNYNATVPSGDIFLISQHVRMTINQNGTLTVASGGNFIIYGTVSNSGAITNSGNIDIECGGSMNGNPVTDNPAVNLCVTNGIDISHNNGQINWKQVAGSVTFVYVKATQGLKYKDPKFISNMQNGYNNGLEMGAYHFACPFPDKHLDCTNTGIDDPRKEADHFVKVAANYLNMGLPPALDVEDTFFHFSPPKNSQYKTIGAYLSWWCQQWFQEVESKTHAQKLVLYTSDGDTQYLSGLTGYDLWDAKYSNTSPNPQGSWSSWTYWQYSSTGNVKGINGIVDLDQAKMAP